MISHKVTDGYQELKHHLQPSQKSPSTLQNPQDRCTTPVPAVSAGQHDQHKFPDNRQDMSRAARTAQGSPTALEQPGIFSGKGQRYLSRDQCSFSCFLPLLLSVPGFTFSQSLLRYRVQQHLMRTAPPQAVPRDEPTEDAARPTQACRAFALFTLTDTLTHAPKRGPACAHTESMTQIPSY